MTVYPGEWRPAVLLFLAFFLCVTFQYACKTVRQSTYIDALGSANLPYVYLLVALLSYPVVRLHARLAARFSSRSLVVGTYLAVATGLAIFWWLYQFPWPWVSVVFYTWISIAIALTLSQLWSLASHVFDARQARRLFGLLGAGALLGGVAGGMVARLAAHLNETRDSLLAAAVLLLGTVALLSKLEGASDGSPAAPPAARADVDHPTRTGFQVVRKSRQLRLLALLMLAVIVVSQIVDLQFNWAVESSTTTLADRTAFYGNFFSIMGVAAFVFQLLLTTRIHRLLGVGFALRVLPASMALGTTGLFVAAALFPGTLIAVAFAVKLAECGVRYSIDDSTRELLFLPVPTKERVPAKAFLDVVVKRGAKGIAAVLLFPVTLGWISPLEAGWFSLAIVVGWLVVTSRITHEYVRSFRHGLRGKMVDDAISINLADVTTLEILVQSLGSADPRQVLHSLELLAAHGRGHLVPPLLLYHDDSEVRQRTLQILAAEGREDAAPLVERRLGDLDPGVRAEATRVLAELWHQDACVMMLPRLHARDPGVRAAAVACLANHGDDAAREEASATLMEMLSDGEPEIRIEAAQALGVIGEPHFDAYLVQLLYDGEPEVVRAAVRAVQRRSARHEPNPIYLPTLVSLLANRALKHDVRKALAAFGERAIPALLFFMNEPDETIWVRRAIPKTIASIASPAAGGALIDSLDHPTDTFLRRKLLEALDSLELTLEDPAREQKVRREIDAEATRYLISLADLLALNPEAAAAVDSFQDPSLARGGAPALLEQLLAERAANLRANLFHLLAILHERRPIWDAYRGLRTPALRAHALEFLDNTLAGDERRSVLAAIGDAPLADKLTRAERLFGIARRSRLATLHKHLGPQDENVLDLPFLAVGAIYTVYAERITELYPVVESLQATATDPFVLETAAWFVESTREV
ncbi:MAG: HEAT repeat domain-containing protein [Acidobacteriota bacterium]|nr:HEAT repeat domain-containing protein [Acidobacteriota bacterium]